MSGSRIYQIVVTLSALLVAQGFYFFRKANTLPLDENGRLKSHWLVHSNNLACQKYAKDLWGHGNELREIASVDSPISDEIFGSENKDPDACMLACLDRGASVSNVGYVIPEKIFDTKSENNAREWLTDWCQRVEVGFISYLPDTEIILSWVSPNGERIETGQIGYGEKLMVWQHSTLGHRFEATNADTGELIGEYVAEFDGVNLIGGRGGTRVTAMNVTREIQATLSHELDRALGVKRTFTEFGFSRSKLPRDLWSSMDAFYYNNRDNHAREEWENKGFYVNWWERDAYIIHMPWDLKKYWQTRLMQLVRDWIGGYELETTDIYGMRRYEEGARLLTHVDRTSTHATSLIINIAQGIMREPWMVEIYDFAGRLHLVPMDPGDIVYYESARCLHGRMNPLRGEYYVNLFSHYRPIGDPSWNLKSNPRDGVKQLLDLGSCELSSAAEGSDVPGRVHCSKVPDSKIPFISTGMESVTHSNDLFDYWLRTAHTEEEQRVIDAAIAADAKRRTSRADMRSFDHSEL